MKWQKEKLVHNYVTSVAIFVINLLLFPRIFLLLLIFSLSFRHVATDRYVVYGNI